MDIVFVLFLSFTLIILWRLKRRTRTSSFFLLSLFLLMVAVGMIRFDLAEKNKSPLREEIHAVRVWEGVVVREPDRRNTSTHLYILEKETNALVLVITDPFELVEYGDRITVKGALKKPESFETDTGRTFDYVGYLKSRGVSEMISYGDVTVVERGGGNVILRRLYSVKYALMEAMEKAIPEPAVGLGEGLVLGVKRALGENLTETFRVAGIIHIVVLSGYNIMIVADFVMRILGYFFFPRTRLALGIAAIVFFALLVGLSATVVRASIMAVFVLIARTAGKRYAALRGLSIAGIIMLMINPYLLAFDPGFQLSFLATLGIILLAPELEKRFTKVPATVGIRGYLATTIATQLYVLPLLLFSMGAVSLVSVLVNLLVLPLVPFAMLTTFVVGVLGLISSTVALVVGYIPFVLLMYMIKVATFAASIPFASVSLPPFHPIFVAIMFIALGAFTYMLKFRNKQKGKIKSLDTTQVENDYEGWVIETEKENPLPFK